MTRQEFERGMRLVNHWKHERFPEDYYIKTFNNLEMQKYDIVMEWNDIGLKEIRTTFDGETFAWFPWLTSTFESVFNAIIKHKENRNE